MTILGVLIPGLSNDDFEDTYDSRIIFLPEESGFYFIEVTVRKPIWYLHNFNAKFG